MRSRVGPASTQSELPPLPLPRTQTRTERVYQEGPPACKGGGATLLCFRGASCATQPPMPRTKKSIKNRSKVKKAALKRKRARRNKGLRRGMRAR